MSAISNGGDVAIFVADGVWRVYFNSHSAAPRVWCISAAAEPGRWEITVAAVSWSAPGSSVYSEELRGSPDLPCAWIVVPGKLTVYESGRATIH